jgi:Tfp pilus assembly protein FimT
MWPRRERLGFTLVELCVVMLLIVALTAVAVPSLAGFWQASQARNCAWQVAALAHRARDYAISHAVRVALEYDQAQGRFFLSVDGENAGEFQELQLAGAQAVTIPDAVASVDITVEDGEAGAALPVVFFPDGQALAARIVLEGAHGGWSIAVVPLTGQAKVSASDEGSQAADARFR